MSEPKRATELDPLLGAVHAERVAALAADIGAQTIRAQRFFTLGQAASSPDVRLLCAASVRRATEWRRTFCEELQEVAGKAAGTSPDGVEVAPMAKAIADALTAQQEAIDAAFAPWLAEVKQELLADEFDAALAEVGGLDLDPDTAVNVAKGDA